jgi:hypothetical protein
VDATHLLVGTNDVASRPYWRCLMNKLSLAAQCCRILLTDILIPFIVPGDNGDPIGAHADYNKETSLDVFS